MRRDTQPTTRSWLVDDPLRGVETDGLKRLENERELRGESHGGESGGPVQMDPPPQEPHNCTSSAAVQQPLAGRSHVR